MNKLAILPNTKFKYRAEEKTLDTARKLKLTRPKEEEAKEEKLLALTTKASRGRKQRHIGFFIVFQDFAARPPFCRISQSGSRGNAQQSQG